MAAGAPPAECPRDRALHSISPHRAAQPHSGAPSTAATSSCLCSFCSSCYVHPQLCTPIPSIPAAAAMAGGTAAPAEQPSQASTVHPVWVLCRGTQGSFSPAVSAATIYKQSHPGTFPASGMSMFQIEMRFCK